MHILVLGSAAGGGHPQWNCCTPASLRAWHQAPGAQRRTQTSVAISADSQQWIMINAAPDFRQQILSTPHLWPRRGRRDSPIQAVILTGGEIDQIIGLLSMRESQRFSLYASHGVQRILANNAIFQALHPAFVKRHIIHLDDPWSLFGLTFNAFAVPGKEPLFLESADPNKTQCEDLTVGMSVSDGHRHVFFIPGCAAIEPDLLARVKGADLLFFDGTLWHDNELRDLGVSTKTGQRMGHLSISAPHGTLTAFQQCQIRQKYFIHVNTTNPILNANSSERAQVRSLGWDVAYDGMEIRV